MIGLDTSFFFAFARGHSEAESIYREVMTKDRDAFVSSITVFELRRHGFRGTLDREFVNDLMAFTGVAFALAGIDDVGVLDRAARISHGMGLSAADSMIIASLESAQCSRLYTSDSDFTMYDGSLEIVFLRQQ